MKKFVQGIALIFGCAVLLAVLFTLFPNFGTTAINVFAIMLLCMLFFLSA